MNDGGREHVDTNINACTFSISDINGGMDVISKCNSYFVKKYELFGHANYQLYCIKLLEAIANKYEEEEKGN
jgi:hypothetical protein